MTLLDDWTLRLALLRRAQGRSEGSDEGLLSLAAGEMPWRPYTERNEDYGQVWLQGTRTDVFRLSWTWPTRSETGTTFLAWKRLCALGCVWKSKSPRELGRSWNASRIELGIRQSRVMDERNW